MIDLSEIRFLFEGEPDELKAFCRDVAIAIESAIAQLETAGRNGAWADARAEAHELRGLAGNVGARTLAALCASFEATERFEPTAADDALRAIAAEFVRVNAALRES